MATSNAVKCKNSIQRKALPIKELERVWITNNEACELLQCSRDFLESLRENAEIAFSRIGGRCYYELASIYKMFERHKVCAKS